MDEFLEGYIESKNRLRESKVGCFYYALGKVYSEEVNVRDGDSYGDYVNHAAHSDLFDRLSKTHPRMFGYVEYDYYPRGRVVYNTKEGQYIIYIDKTINREDVIEKVSDQFDLRPGSFIVDDEDEHYVSLSGMKK